jgi:hypothetical protein
MTFFAVRVRAKKLFVSVADISNSLARRMKGTSWNRTRRQIDLTKLAAGTDAFSHRGIFLKRRSKFSRVKNPDKYAIHFSFFLATVRRGFLAG